MWLYLAWVVISIHGNLVHNAVETDPIKWETPLKYAAKGAPEGLIINVLH